jgi:SOS-response transcriptional repressor LexA
MTPLQRRVYDFVETYWSQNGFGPTYEAIALGVGLSGKSSVHRVVHQMATEGWLELRQSRHVRARMVRTKPIGTKEWQAGYDAGYAAAKRGNRPGRMSEDIEELRAARCPGLGGVAVPPVRQLPVGCRADPCP